MKTILKIYKRDLKNIFKNSMAIILVIGVALLPSLYAWFNIYANWDPYGSTGNMQVAVINSDTGTVIKDIDVCIGEQIVSNLKSNNSIDWQFVSKEEAIDGVKSGKYYAAVEIPENFSSSLTSILTTEFIQPKITYYANEKKNAIATKITDKVVTTVQTQVNESFVSTVADVLSQVFGIISDDVSAADENLCATLTEQINAAKASVDGLDSTLSGFAETSKLIKELGTDINSYDFSSLNSNTNAAINNTSDAIKMMQNSMNGITDTVGVFLGDIDKDMNSAAVSINNAADRINEIKSDETINAELHNAYDKCTDIALKTESVSSALFKINSSLPKPLSKLDELIQRLNNITDIADKTASDINMVIKNNSKETDFTDITLKLNNISNEIKTVSDDYNNTVKQQIDKTISSLLISLNDASDMLSLIDNDKEKIDTILKSLNAATAAGTVSADSFQTLLKSVSSELDVLLENINNLSQNEEFNTFRNLLKSNSKEFGAFVACPVAVETDKIYEIENYGSAMAPFYSTLAIWVGGVVLVAILKTDVKNKKQLGNIKPYQEYFGRGLLFVTFALVQGLIICLGDLCFLNIQCCHPFLFVLAGCFASLVYSLLIYSLTVTFGDIGKAIAVILLVIQIGGSGGTFPIDVTPTFFRTINPFLPFTFVVNAMRECICGSYGSDYWIDLLKLSVYIIIALVIGLLIRIPFRKPISFFNERLEDTDVM